MRCAASVRAALGALFLVAAPVAAASEPAPGERATLTVFAAASLSEPFGELGRMLERARPGLRLRFNFAGSQQLAAQIEQGAGADLFASADERWMSYLSERGLLAGDPHVFAHNGLVVIVPRSNPARITRLEQLARRGVKLVLGAPAVPVGAYSREVLKRLATQPGYASDYAGQALANVVSEEENVKSVLAKVQLGEADAGMVYRSDVTPAVARYLRVFELPAAAQITASYPIAAVRGGSQPEAARSFLDLLDSGTGRAVLTRHRLTPSSPATP
jgi:molybdate transport system substrate-binding protein